MAAVLTKEAVKEAILDATDRLLARYGYKKMTVEDIAIEVGIGKGTIYLHFTSKEEIVLSHVDRIVERVKERLREIARSDAPAAEKLRQMLLTRVLVRFDSIQHYTQSLDDLLAALRPGLHARRALYFEAETQIFAELLRAGCKSGEFEFEDEQAIARALLQATNGFLPYSLSTAELGARDEVAKRAGNVVDLVMRGLMKRK